MNPPHITSYSSQYPQYGQPQGQNQANGAANQAFYYGNYHPQQQQYYYNGTPSAPATGTNSATGSVTGSPATNTSAVTAAATAGGDSTATPTTAATADPTAYQAYYGTPIYQQQAASTAGAQSNAAGNQHHQHLHHHIQQQQQQSQQIQAQTPYYNQYPPYMPTHQGAAATTANTQYNTHNLQAQHSLVAQQQQQQHQQQHQQSQQSQQSQHSQQNATLQPPVVTDPTGQTAPPGSKPKVTTTLWEDEGTLCFQVEARGICVARREDNDMINGTKLLNVAGMTRGRRDGILKGEKNRHVVKAGAMHLKGVWIPYERALDFANKEKIIDLLYPLFVTDIKAVLYHPANYARTAQVISAAAERRKDLATAGVSVSNVNPSQAPVTVITPTTTATTTTPGAVQSSQSYYYQDGRKDGSNDNSPTSGDRKLPQLPNPPSSASPSVIQGVQGTATATAAPNEAYSTAPSSRVPTPTSNAFANGQQQTQPQSNGSDYHGSTIPTPITDSPHTPSSNLLKTNGQSDDQEKLNDSNVADSGHNSSNTSPKIYGDESSIKSE